MVALLVACIQPTRAVTLSIELVTSHHRLVLKLSWRKKKRDGAIITGNMGNFYTVMYFQYFLVADRLEWVGRFKLCSNFSY